MKHMDTASDAITHLEAKGYVEQLTLADDGRIAVGDGATWQAEAVEVDETIRFEGMSNPDDESMVLAITGPDRRRGVLTLPYGPDLSGPQADAVRRLSQRS